MSGSECTYSYGGYLSPGWEEYPIHESCKNWDAFIATPCCGLTLFSLIITVIIFFVQFSAVYRNQEEGTIPIPPVTGKIRFKKPYII